jgi:alpha-mannosidase
MFDPRIEPFKPQLENYWAGRALYQIEYAHEVSKAAHGQFDDAIEEAISFLVGANSQEGVITKTAAQQVELLLAPVSPAAKRYNVVCAAHAHIDMNWMWRWDETVAITLDTFRTMLNLMQEYPDFKFSQSQASVYQIVEQYDPDMLAEIRQRVQQGRWEVTAATWVEADKNMPNGESAARHLLYTRRYLKELLDLTDGDFQFDFEPDTFGHHANIPEILADGGVKYYYHCRGDKGHNLHRWLAPSGRSIIVYREPSWYLGYIDPGLALYAPAFCQKYGLDTILKVYGVGDHGGGPTRRDVERLLDMAAWPVFPTIRFGAFGDYFNQVAPVADQLPVVEGELNFIFTGCYTSQSRIKRANRLSEASLHTSETFSALAALQGLSYPAEKYALAWKNTLFNQFHDIIPGSGVIDTREYALGLFQDTMAIASSQKRRAFNALTGDTDQIQADPATADPQAISEGAGVGFGVEEFRLSQVSRAGGLCRLFHIFNPTPRPRQEVVELVVWDWQGDLQRLVVDDENGEALPFQIVDQGWNNYWGHKYLRVLVQAAVPACGYGSVVLYEADTILDSKVYPLDMRTEDPPALQLENEHLIATFDTQSCALISLLDKASGAELVDPHKPAVFRRIQEDVQEMTAWVVGRYKTVQSLTEDVRLLNQDTAGPLRGSFTYEVCSGASKLTVTVSLRAGSHRLEFDAQAEWLEIGRKGEGVPQLNFSLPLAQPVQAYRYDIPFGIVERPAMALDVPGNSWGAAIPESAAPVLQIISEGSYGFRGDQNSLSLTLIRSSFDPDPHPELGIHKIRFALAVLSGASGQDLIASAAHYCQPLDVVSAAGQQAARWGFLTQESGTATLAAIKVPEDGQERTLVIRLYETESQPVQTILCFAIAPVQAEWVDVHEQAIADLSPPQIQDDRLTFTLPSYRFATLRVKFAS